MNLQALESILLPKSPLTCRQRRTSGQGITFMRMVMNERWTWLWLTSTWVRHLDLYTLGKRCLWATTPVWVCRTG